MKLRLVNGLLILVRLLRIKMSLVSRSKLISVGRY